ncbi:MAG: hypothetical protein F6K18_21340 [Okeania sp. SIO2C2]|uniref:hypothetical protein n=1 Tax=Okeania sp. SIO2C2 TaxID=2607787 RepID=UPI0013BA7968|nr:hypothetical protein [Okeania sp. SIO2C2]NEP89167.1 hypothetical protein [Okeania sp. SIO2C2]
MLKKALFFVTTTLSVLASLSVANLSANAANFLSFTSEPGDFIGQGRSQFYTPDDRYFRVSRNFDNGFTLGFNDFAFGGRTWWSLDLAAANNQTLTPGNYEGATRFPFQDSSEPGLSFSGNGRGCNRLTGQFNVEEFVYDSYGEPERFKADFEQHCEGKEAALFGQVEFDRSEFDRANMARLMALSEEIQEYDTAFYFYSQPGDYIGGGNEQLLTPEEVDFRVTMGRNNNVSFRLDNISNSQPGDRIWWNLNFAAPERSLLAPGWYDRAIRYPFQPNDRPGLSFSGNGRGCNRLGGRFNILEAAYDVNGDIKSFDAIFEQHCEDELAIGPASFGRIRYNAEVESTPEPSAVLGLFGIGSCLLSLGQRRGKKATARKLPREKLMY